MGYFDGIASGIIKKDKDGNGVYYPWGVLGKGYMLPSIERETKIKNMVILFLVKSKQLTKDCPKSDEKLTIKEGYTNSAKAHYKTVLWILFGVSVVFTLGAIALLFSGKTLVLGIFGAILFGASSVAIYYMIQVKNNQEKEPN